MSDENLALLREIYAAWAGGNFATADAFDPDVEFVRLGTGASGLDGTWHGIDGLWAAVVEWLRSWELLTIEAERFIELGDNRALVLSRQRGRGKHSGAQMDAELGDLFTFRNGKIIRYASYWDRAEALRAAGLEP